MQQSLRIFLLGLFIVGFSSCYTFNFSVGDGAQGDREVVEKNHYVIYGLVPVATADPGAMAKGADDYDVEISHTFIDGLINAITGGIYNPVTVKVTR